MKYTRQMPFKELRRVRAIGTRNSEGKKYYTDGFVIGSKNPSDFGGGYTIVDSNNNLIEHVRIDKSGFTNNEGEVMGILVAARLAVPGDCISTDSMCCLAWANKGKSKARADLNYIFAEIKLLIKEKGLNLMWEGRDHNLAGIYNENRPRSELVRRPKDSIA